MIDKGCLVKIKNPRKTALERKEGNCVRFKVGVRAAREGKPGKGEASRAVPGAVGRGCWAVYVLIIACVTVTQVC